MQTNALFSQVGLFLFRNVFKTKFNGLTNIFECRINRFALRVTAIKHRAFYPITAGFVFVDNDRELIDCVIG